MPRMKKFLALPLFALFAGCQSIVTTPIANCSGFVHDSLRTPVPPAPLPDFSAADNAPDELTAAQSEAKAWQGFGVNQSGQLSKANADKVAVLHIFDECERRNAEARPRKKFLGIF